jgi:hypothetical protein
MPRRGLTAQHRVNVGQHPFSSLPMNGRPDVQPVVVRGVRRQDQPFVVFLRPIRVIQKRPDLVVDLLGESLMQLSVR